MKVVITGASGAIGQAIVPRLLAEGIEVIGLDKKASQLGIRLVLADLCDLGHVYTALIGADAVIHLGALPSPHHAPADVVYSNNVLSQFNVFEAAANLGIRRIVNISSVSALGFPFQLRSFQPYYFPIDEEHPLLPQDSYGLSKATGEEIAAAYCRRGCGSVASLRLSTVVGPDEREKYHMVIDRAREHPDRGIRDLWSYVDARDVAQACLLALTANFEGHQPFFITAADTMSLLPTDELLDRYYPDVPRRDGVRPGRWSLLDGKKASQLLGYHPSYSWSEALKNS
ncbi:epimerase [Ktedonobacter sp. SOSP1-52]|uniref:NAD-dependent epimerase/dehydratase family protein n=1 Tax=Ktedonobacter sp. SOSP1-52 TaxID=2778366 RepID=UPI001915AC81|nr:NAD(P)-dependent oxidoreductase [Ktedonobacter sp. SOSP1-52]GHO72130.1 epimerase [Ktedonobacter sp. SOSP1-52]